MSIVVVGNGTPESIFNIESFVNDNTKSITFRHIVTEPKTLAKIKELTLEHCFPAQWLPDSDSLTSLTIRDDYDFDEFMSFKKFPNLKRLILRNLDIFDFSFEQLPDSLEYLDLSLNPILEIKGTLPPNLKTLHLDKTKIVNKPDYPCLDSYSFDSSDCLKTCAQCQELIENIQPYYNKEKDGNYVCVDCHDDLDESEADKYEYKVNIMNRVFNCDSCGKPVRRSAHFNIQGRISNNYWDFTDTFICSECADEEDIITHTMPIDTISPIIYPVNVDKSIRITKGVVEDDEVEIKEVIKYFLEKESLTLNELKFIFLSKHLDESLDISKIKKKDLLKVFQISNSYLMEYAIRNYRFSVKELIEAAWQMMAEYPCSFIYTLKEKFPLFYSKEHMLDKFKLKDFYIEQCFLNDNVDSIYYLECIYDTDITLNYSLDLYKKMVMKKCFDSINYLDWEPKIEDTQDALNEFLKSDELAVNQANMIFSLSNLHPKEKLKITVSPEKIQPIFYEMLEWNIELERETIDNFYSQHKAEISNMEPHIECFKDICTNNMIKRATIMKGYFDSLMLEIKNDVIVDYGVNGVGLYKTRDNNSEPIVPQECPICLEEPCAIITGCGHQFCKACVKQSLDVKNSCPMCRTEIDGKLYYI